MCPLFQKKSDALQLPAALNPSRTLDETTALNPSTHPWKLKPIFEYIPIESQIEKFQTEYYDAIAQCHRAGSSTGFIEFMLSQIDKILDDIPAQINEENHLLSDYVQKLLSVMEYDIPYTSNALMKKLDLKSKETFRKNYLHPAIKLDLIRMTIPDKPRSRSQKYIKLWTQADFLAEKFKGDFAPLYYANISPLKYEHRR